MAKSLQYSLVFRWVALAALTCTTMSCDSLQSAFHTEKYAHVRHNKPTKAHYDAQNYIKHLALAKLGLQANAADSAAVSKNLDIIEAYAAQKAARPERQTIIIFEYKNNGSDTMEKISSPLGTAQKANFSDLAQIMDRMSNYTLHNLRLAVTVVSPGEELKLPDGSANEIRQALDEQQGRLIAHAENISTLDDARLQLQLIGFFIDHHARDAAYLSVDNVKQLLAAATHDQSASPDTIKALLRQLEGLEGRLHKEMPFTL